ncbi:hypothetical protein DMA11_09605 [Marinilabiliaceae bacterium JC017]|nr:hypothetical protein DMA11_09605 [Marinilabiliaceae bacterium JC017]
MTKALLYKEWLKTRWVIYALLLTGIVLHAYLFIKLGRTFRFAGKEHLWDVIINRNRFLFEPVQYFPLIAGLLVGLAQYVPETYQKRLKLHLHLPLPEKRLTLAMNGAGITILIGLFSLFIGLLLTGISVFFTSEFVTMAFITICPWYLGGLTIYGFTAWVCLEPSWKMRIANTLIAIFFTYFFYMSAAPGSYEPTLAIYSVATLLPIVFIFHSINRFKSGKQD